MTPPYYIKNYRIDCAWGIIMQVGELIQCSDHREREKE